MKAKSIFVGPGDGNSEGAREHDAIQMLLGWQRFKCSWILSPRPRRPLL